ncbi:uncharacterized protein HD556DRAFT_1304770 [Suillus plorans]|uniref:DUF6532 domain-containing protein n=1 Tax=Suillus plorans TaxID=116603 RepID=A0A9P7J398_9AGAM|nr:uncharacterized protein HD556DRAFT_1304770 [Suillus plorans]KAG1800755.1 hypothetical protein HD556DRAFT_1304770 [Suillus plorans]
MAPRKAKAKKAPAKKALAKPTSTSSTFTASQAKELEKLLKAKNAAESAQEQEKKKEEEMESEKEPDISEDDNVSPPPSEPRNHSHTRTSPPSLIGGPSKKPHLQTLSRQKVNTISDLLAHNGFSLEEEGGVVPSRDEQEEQDTEVNVSLKKRKNTVLEDQEVEVGDDGDSRNTPTSGRTSNWKAKVNLSEFSTPHVRHIAQLGNRDMRHHGVLVEGFPSTIYKEDKSWEVLTLATSAHKNLQIRLKEVEDDLDIKDMLVNYMNRHGQGLRSMRAKLMIKARQRAPTWYGLTNLEPGEEIASACQWLLQENRFLYGGVDIKERTYDRTKPWLNLGLVYLIGDQFWTIKGDAMKMGRDNNRYIDFPDPLLALSASAIQCSLKGFSINGKLKGSGSVVAFTDENFHSEWMTYITLLGDFKIKTPSFYKLMKIDMLEVLVKMSSEAANIMKYSTSVMSVDMDALKEAAKQRLAEKEVY